jgi:methyl-accepting chemotaxis protein
MKKRSSVSFFLVASNVVSVVVYSVILMALIYSQLKSGLTAYFIDYLQVGISSSEQSITDIRSELKKFTVLSAKNIESVVRDYGQMDSFAVDGIIGNIAASYDADSYVVVDSDGKAVSSTKFGSVGAVSSITTKVLLGQSISDIMKSGSDLYIYHAEPIRSGAKVLGGVIFSKRITTDAFVKRVSEISDCVFTIFDGTKRIYTTVPGMQGTEIADKKPIDTVNRGERYKGTAVIGRKHYVVCYFPLMDTNGKVLTTLFLGKDIDVVRTLEKQIFISFLIVAIICSVIILGILIVISSRKVIRPLNLVNESIAHLSSGDADLTMQLPVKGNDEFAEIAANTNKFISMLRNIVIELNSAEGSLASIGQNLNTNAQQSVQATDHIMTNIHEVRQQSEGQATSVENTMNILLRTESGISKLNELVESQAAGITESSAAIEEMLGNISSVTGSVRKMSDSFRELEETVGDGKTKLADVDSKVTEIAEQSKMLLQANTIIAQIASETNLLAMNAAIEAAHAGKAGEGFSVVANEIRKLAETSSQQSKNINSELKFISSSIKDVVSLSKDSQTAFGEIITRLDSTDAIIREIDNAMDEQDKASRQIFGALSNMRNQAGEVSEQSREMNGGIREVGTHMESVSQISNTILNSMDEISSGADQIGKTAQGVSSLAEKTQDNIGVMREKLKLFRV